MILSKTVPRLMQQYLYMSETVPDDFVPTKLESETI